MPKRSSGSPSATQNWPLGLTILVVIVFYLMLWGLIFW